MGGLSNLPNVTQSPYLWTSRGLLYTIGNAHSIFTNIVILKKRLWISP